MGVNIALVTIYPNPYLFGINLVTFGLLGSWLAQTHGKLVCPRCGEHFLKPISTWWFGVKGWYPPTWQAPQQCQNCGLSLTLLQGKWTVRKEWPQ